MSTEFIAICFFFFIYIIWSRRKIQNLKLENSSLELKRNNDRQGRINAEKALREVQQRNQSERKQSNEESNSEAMSIVGTVRSCFSKRAGTPRKDICSSSSVN